MTSFWNIQRNIKWVIYILKAGKQTEVNFLQTDSSICMERLRVINIKHKARIFFFVHYCLNIILIMLTYYAYSSYACLIAIPAFCNSSILNDPDFIFLSNEKSMVYFSLSPISILGSIQNYSYLMHSNSNMFTHHAHVFNYHTF